MTVLAGREGNGSISRYPDCSAGLLLADDSLGLSKKDKPSAILRMQSTTIKTSDLGDTFQEARLLELEPIDSGQASSPSDFWLCTGLLSEGEFDCSSYAQYDMACP